MVHELKILDKYFDAVDSNIKPFEVRKNDRDFHVGDMLHLREVEERKNGELTYTGRYCEKYITSILSLDGQFGDGKYVVLGLKDKTYPL